jgi:hypothetical protein
MQVRTLISFSRGKFITRFWSVRSLQRKSHAFLEDVIQKYPRIYLGGVTLLALAGYAVILLFPLLLLAGIMGIYQALTADNNIAWQSASLWLVIAIISGLISYRYLQYKPSPPVGLTLIEDKAPGLFRLVQEMRSHFKRPVIHRIVVTPDYELDIIKTPRWALPLWSMNTLVIGLPVLQCLTVRQFECIVARRLGQFSKRENPLSNWLYQLRAIWQQYLESYRQHKGPGIEPMKWIFSAYAPLYSACSVYAARRDELNADVYAMELYNDEEVCEMVTADAVCRHYLHKRYWPAVYKIAAIETKTLPAPHRKMASAVHAILKGENLAKLIDETVKEKQERKNPAPILQARIQNIGHSCPYMNEFDGTAAAEHYLGSSMNRVIALIDKLWLKTLLEERKKQHHQKHTHTVSTPATS